MLFNLPVNLFKLLTLSTIVIISIKLCNIVSFPKQYYRYIKWNIEELKQDLSEKIYGQDEAIRQLLSAVNESQYNDTDHTVVVLLGGPGVGKTYVSQILKDHNKCIKKTDEIKYTDWSEIPNLFEIKKPELDYNILCYQVYDLENYIVRYDSYTLEYFVEQNPYPYYVSWYNKYLWPIFKEFVLVIPTILELEDLEKFATSQEYMDFLDEFETNLKSHLSHLDFQVIKFKPMKSYHVRWCAQDQLKDLFIFHDRSEKDFVEKGCKM